MPQVVKHHWPAIVFGCISVLSVASGWVYSAGVQGGENRNTRQMVIEEKTERIRADEALERRIAAEFLRMQGQQGRMEDKIDRLLSRP